jgi:hypothetical protein
MKPITFLISAIIFFGCRSVPEKVKADKEKYIQIAKENSKPIEISDLKDIYQQANENKTEAKIKYLGVDKIETYYAGRNSEVNLDSIVVFVKSGYLIFYDFALIARKEGEIKQLSSLNKLEKIDDRLFIGKR